jgi:hypothetical protein
MAVWPLLEKSCGAGRVAGGCTWRFGGPSGRIGNSDSAVPTIPRTGLVALAVNQRQLSLAVKLRMRSRMRSSLCGSD